MSVRVVTADMVEPAPTDCPLGTRATISHAGPHCAPASCDQAHQCPKGETCAVERLCVVERNFVNMTGRGTVMAVKGPCQNDQCVEGTCRSERVCTSPHAAGGTPPATKPTDGGAAQAVQATGGRRAPGQKFEDRPVDNGPNRTPSGCSARGWMGAVYGVILASLVGVIAVLLRRRASQHRR
jgi:hypothetical protein